MKKKVVDRGTKLVILALLLMGLLAFPIASQEAQVLPEQQEQAEWATLPTGERPVGIAVKEPRAGFANELVVIYDAPTGAAIATYPGLLDGRFEEYRLWGELMVSPVVVGEVIGEHVAEGIKEFYGAGSPLSGPVAVAEIGGKRVFLIPRSPYIFTAEIGGGNTSLLNYDIAGFEARPPFHRLLSEKVGKLAEFPRGIASIAVADFNIDRHADLAIVAGRALYILPGDGTGNFLTPNIRTVFDTTDPELGWRSALENLLELEEYHKREAFPRGRTPNFVTAVDLNNDQVKDIVVAIGGILGGDAYVLLNRGDGKFVPPIGYEATNEPRFIIAGDFNEDGTQDLIVAGDTEVVFLPGTGGGTFGTAETIGELESDPLAAPMMVIGNFEGDTTLDFAVTNVGNSAVNIYRGVGDGSFSRQEIALPAGAIPSALIAEDLDGDGDLDLVVTSKGTNELVILANTGAPTQLFVHMKRPRIAEAPAPSSIAIGDFDGDGQVDLAVSRVMGNRAGNVMVMFGAVEEGRRIFEPFVVEEEKIDGLSEISVGIYPTSVAIGNFNFEDDRWCDLVVANFGTNTLTLVLSSPRSPREPTPNTGHLPTGIRPRAVAVENFNERDGRKNDIAAVCYLTNTVYVYLDVNSQLPTDFRQHATGRQPVAVTVGDFNKDGHQDLAIANFGSNDVTIWFNNGEGRFIDRHTVPVGIMPMSIVTADFNNDDRDDLAVANFGSNDITILLNRGDSTFDVETIEDYEGEGPISIVAFGGENGSDLAVANFVSNNVTILRSNGDGTFEQEIRKDGTDIRGRSARIANGPIALAVGEFNDTVGLDLAVAVEFPTAELLYTEEEVDAREFAPARRGAALRRIKDAIKGLTRNVFIIPEIGKAEIAIGENDNEQLPPVESTSTAIALASGDFNRDYRLDLAVLTLITPIRPEGETRPTKGRVDILHGSDRADSSPYLARSLEVGKWSSALQAGDIDNAGSTDLVILATAANKVAFRWGPGLDQIHTELVGIAPAALAVGAFDHGSWTMADSTILISTQRSFTRVNLDFKGSRARAAAAAVNLAETGRGPPDLVVLDNISRVLTFRGSDLITAAGSPDRVITPTSIRSLLEHGAASALAVGDFDGDGRYDLVVVFRNRDEGTILFGAGAERSFPTGGDSPNGLAVGDLNRDGLQDIVVGKSFSDELTVLYGTGNGFFSEGPPINLGTEPRDRGLLIADLNSDGRPDIAAVHENVDYITILYNTLGPAAEEISLGEGEGEERITVRQWIFHPAIPVRAERPIELPPQVPEPEPEPVVVELLQPEPAPTEPALGGFVARGILRMAAKVEAAKAPDLIVVCQESDTLSFLSGTGHRENPFAWARTLELGMGASDVALGDFDGDGHRDVAVVNTAANSLTILWGGDRPGMSLVSTSVAPFAVAAADFNADTHQDLAVISQGSNKITMFLSQGGVRDFTSKPVIGPDSSGALAVADLNADGRDDLVVTDLLRSQIVFFLNTTPTESGIISFDSYSADLPSYTRAALLMVDDVDRDGALDVVALGRDPSRLFVFLNDGFGNFSRHTAHSVGEHWRNALLSDFTGDGFPDLVLVEGLSRVILLYPNQGDGSFAARPIVFLAGEDPHSLTAADFDQDGTLDLVVATTVGQIWILWGIEGEATFEAEAAEVVVRRL